MKKRLTIKEAAQLMGAPAQFIRVGLQMGMFPWGVAQKRSSKYTYYINAFKFCAENGINEEEVAAKLAGQA